MTEHFFHSNIVSRETLSQLLQKKDQPALIHFTCMWLLLLGAAAAVVWTWAWGVWWQILPALFLFGIMCCSTFACLHETAHNTAFKSLALNRIAALLCGIAHIYPAATFRELHFTHHRHTHQPGLDPEISLGNKPAPSVTGSLFMYLSWITGLPLLLFKLGMTIMGTIGMPEPVRRRIFPFIDPQARWAVMLDSWLVLAIHSGIVVLAIWGYSGCWGLLIGQLVGHSLLAGYLIMEHNGLPHEGSIMDRTRSIPTSAFVKWIFWNMPYHAEHHAYPAIPYFALPLLHQALQKEIKHGDETHTQFHLKVLSGKINTTHTSQK